MNGGLSSMLFSSACSCSAIQVSVKVIKFAFWVKVSVKNCKSSRIGLGGPIINPNRNSYLYLFCATVWFVEQKNNIEWIAFSRTMSKWTACYSFLTFCESFVLIYISAHIPKPLLSVGVWLVTDCLVFGVTLVGDESIGRLFEPFAPFRYFLVALDRDFFIVEFLLLAKGRIVQLVNIFDGLHNFGNCFVYRRFYKHLHLAVKLSRHHNFRFFWHKFSFSSLPKWAVLGGKQVYCSQSLVKVANSGTVVSDVYRFFLEVYKIDKTWRYNYNFTRWKSVIFQKIALQYVSKAFRSRWWVNC